MIKKLNWDSNFFNLKIGEVYLQKEDLEINDNSFDLLYVKSENEFEITINGYNNTFSDQILIYSKDLKEAEVEIHYPNIISFKETNFQIEKLYELAYIAGKFSRFNLDKKFDEEKFKKLYRMWIDNSLNGSIADEVLIYQENNELVGLVIYKKDREVVTYTLLAVFPEYQGKAIGAKLFEFVAQKMAKQNIKKLIIPTQISNVGACYIYNRLGYVILEKKNIKHYWRI